MSRNEVCDSGKGTFVVALFKFVSRNVNSANPLIYDERKGPVESLCASAIITSRTIGKKRNLCQVQIRGVGVRYSSDSLIMMFSFSTMSLNNRKAHKYPHS
jgi:hypothetical protein